MPARRGLAVHVSSLVVLQVVSFSRPGAVMKSSVLSPFTPAWSKISYVKASRKYSVSPTEDAQPKCHFSFFLCDLHLSVG